MAEVLVYVDHVDGAVRKPTLELLTLARRIGEPVAVALGAGAEATAAVLAEHGAVKVLTADAPEFADYLVVPKVDALQAAYEAVSPAAVLVPSSAEGKEIAARLAVRIGSGIITDAVDLEAGDEGPVATQAAFAASFTTKSRVSKGTPVITVKPNSAPVEAAPAAGAVEALAVTFGALATGTKVVSRTPRESTGRPELTEAAIVVSGGRGVNGAENFHIIEALADSSVRPSVPRAPRSTPAGTRTPTRSARPASRSPRSCTSPPASRARSSTGPACRPRRPSWPSTRTPRPRSSTSSTTAWSATSSRSSRS